MNNRPVEAAVLRRQSHPIVTNQCKQDIDARCDNRLRCVSRPASVSYKASSQEVAATGGVVLKIDQNRLYHVTLQTNLKHHIIKRQFLLNNKLTDYDTINSYDANRTNLFYLFFAPQYAISIRFQFLLIISFISDSFSANLFLFDGTQW